jgi:hypothetical protein
MLYAVVPEPATGHRAAPHRPLTRQPHGPGRDERRYAALVRRAYPIGNHPAFVVLHALSARAQLPGLVAAPGRRRGPPRSWNGKPPERARLLHHTRLLENGSAEMRRRHGSGLAGTVWVGHRLSDGESLAVGHDEGVQDGVPAVDLAGWLARSPLRQSGKGSSGLLARSGGVVDGGLRPGTGLRDSTPFFGAPSAGWRACWSASPASSASSRPGRRPPPVPARARGCTDGQVVLGQGQPEGTAEAGIAWMDS